jgi:BON domain
MPVPTTSIICRLATLLVVAGWSSAAAQSSVGKLPPGTVNAVDQTNEQPAPAAQPGYGGPDTRQERAAIILNGRKALTQRLGAAAASAITVQFLDGATILTGKVSTPEARAAAEQAVRAVPGVTDLQNNIVVESRAR